MQAMDTNERSRPARHGAPAPASGLRNADGSPVTSVRQLVALIEPMTVRAWLATTSAAIPHPDLTRDLTAQGLLDD